MGSIRAIGDRWEEQIGALERRGEKPLEFTDSKLQTMTIGKLHGHCLFNQFHGTRNR